jgi:hypothetical protein
MAVTSAHIFYVGSTAYDLRKVESWWTDPDNATFVFVRFISCDTTAVKMNLAAFEAAKQASMNADG